MYQLVKAVLRSKQPGSFYVTTDVSAKSFSDIIDQFADGYFQIFNNVTGTNVFVSLEGLQQQPLKRVNGNFQLFLTANQDVAIIGSLVEPVLQSIPVLYHNLNKTSNWKFKTIFNNDVSENEISPGSKQNMYVIGKANPIAVSRSSVFTVNGLIHDHYPHPDKRGLVIANGGLTFARKGHTPTVGLLQFSRNSLPAIDRVRFLPERINAVTANPTLRSGFVYDTGTDLNGKTIMFVLLGKLFIQDAGITVVNNTSVFVDLSKIDLLKLILAVGQTLDLRPLGIFDGEFSTDAISIAQLFENEVIKNILTSPYTMLLIVEAPSVGVEYSMTRETTYGGVYTDTSLPNEQSRVYVDDYGLIAECIGMRLIDYGVMIKTSSALTYKEWVYETTDAEQLNVVPSVLADSQTSVRKLRRTNMQMQKLFW